MVMTSLGVTSGLPSFDLVRLHRFAQGLDLGFQRADALHELLDRLGHRIRQVRLVEADLPGPPPTVLVCYAAGHADPNRVGRHFTDDDGARPDPAAVADHEAADDLGAGTDHDVVAERRVTLLALETRAPQRDPMEQCDVLPDLRRLTDDDAHAVVDEEAGPEPGGGMDLDSGQEARDVGNEAGGGAPAAVPDAVGHAMERDRGHPPIAQHHLEPRPRRGVALQRRAYLRAGRRKTSC